MDICTHADSSSTYYIYFRTSSCRICRLQFCAEKTRRGGTEVAERTSEALNSCKKTIRAPEMLHKPVSLIPIGKSGMNRNGQVRFGGSGVLNFRSESCFAGRCNAANTFQKALEGGVSRNRKWFLVRSCSGYGPFPRKYFLK